MVSVYYLITNETSSKRKKEYTPLTVYMPVDFVLPTCA